MFCNLTDVLFVAELKLLDTREVKSSYIGANLQTSRTPSAIDSHCRSSYHSARRKLRSSRAKVSGDVCVSLIAA